MMTSELRKIMGLKIFLIKEVVERSLEDLKVNEVCMFIFAFIKSCCMVAGNLDHCSILRSMIKGKESPLMKGMSSYEV